MAALRLAAGRMHGEMERWTEAHGLSESRLRVLLAIYYAPGRRSAPLGQLLDGPAVAVRVGEEDERAPRELLDFADLDGVSSASGLVAKGKRVVILRTFSKIHGMAGIRVGYAIARPDIIKDIAATTMTSPNIFAMRAARASLFKDDRIDPVIVIRWKGIYEALEDAVDRCDTAASRVGNILVKNA